MQHQTNPIKRSNTYQAIYPDELMVRAFGTVTPSVLQKNTYFFQQWVEWKSQGITLSIDVPRSAVIDVCRKIGLKEFWDYQLRGRVLRFSSAEFLAFFKMAATDIKWS
jgi:hypothetical protein